MVFTDYVNINIKKEVGRLLKKRGRVKFKARGYKELSESKIENELQLYDSYEEQRDGREERKHRRVIAYLHLVISHSIDQMATRSPIKAGFSPIWTTFGPKWSDLSLNPKSAISSFKRWRLSFRASRQIGPNWGLRWRFKEDGYLVYDSSVF